MPFDPKPYAEGLRRLNEAEAKRVSRRLDAARDEAVRLAERIGEADPEIRRVYLFGSVAEGTPRSTDFDIDLAVEGGDVHTAMGATELSDFRVDVVDLDRISQHMRTRIVESGRVLFDRTV